MFAKFDRNQNGRIEWQEFDSVIAGLMPSMGPAKRRALFILLDQDCNGLIDVAEFRQIVSDDDTCHFHDRKGARNGTSASLASPSRMHLNERLRYTHLNERCLPLRKRNHFNQRVVMATEVLRSERIKQRSSGCGRVKLEQTDTEKTLRERFSVSPASRTRSFRR